MKEKCLVIIMNSDFAMKRIFCRLISVEDVRNYLSHIMYILIFDLFLNFVLFVRLQTPISPRCWNEV